ncbi:hypothetical protein B0H63DRAFT_510877 [Podospora didyma]|uniref:Transporter n=1 Tax=Podospora didyma TaxID=330526 RepID=A0AAE0NG83_9PEZI|nr:hypothetical protein B0H63DRAFT_510877 [Podospora didyma]
MTRESNFFNIPVNPQTPHATTSITATGCQLSPAGSAFSAILTAFIGSVINGLTSGWLVAFATGWISWFAVLRVLLSGLYMVYRSISNTWGPGPTSSTASKPQTEGGDEEASQHLMMTSTTYLGGIPIVHGNSQQQQFSTIPVPTLTLTHEQSRQLSQVARSRLSPQIMWPPAEVVRRGAVAVTGFNFGQRGRHYNKLMDVAGGLNQNVSGLGWFGWTYTAVVAPITQTIWVAANAHNHTVGAAKIVKGFTCAISALPLCIDCKVRYGDKVPTGVGRYMFNLWTALSALFQGILGGFLLGTGVDDLYRVAGKTGAGGGGSLALPVAVIYPIFSLVWMYGSYILVPMRDGGRRRAGQAHWTGYFMDVGMGAFAGLFLAAPAFVLFMSARFDKNGHGGGGWTGASDLANDGFWGVKSNTN